MKNDIKIWQEKLKTTPKSERIKSIKETMKKNSDGRYDSKQLNDDLLTLRGKKC